MKEKLVCLIQHDSLLFLSCQACRQDVDINYTDFFLLLFLCIILIISKELTLTWFEHTTFWSGVRRATIAPQSLFLVGKLSNYELTDQNSLVINWWKQASSTRQRWVKFFHFFHSTVCHHYCYFLTRDSTLYAAFWSRVKHATNSSQSVFES